MVAFRRTDTQSVVTCKERRSWSSPVRTWVLLSLDSEGGPLGPVDLPSTPTLDWQRRPVARGSVCRSRVVMDDVTGVSFPHRTVQTGKAVRPPPATYLPQSLSRRELPGPFGTRRCLAEWISRCSPKLTFPPQKSVRTLGFPLRTDGPAHAMGDTSALRFAGSLNWGIICVLNKLNSDAGLQSISSNLSNLPVSHTTCHAPCPSPALP